VVYSEQWTNRDDHVEALRPQRFGERITFPFPTRTSARPPPPAPPSSSTSASPFSLNATGSW
jgi:hypothetical protein